ncbi:non-ribosomal peptide synthetase [Podospora australis]|uniref:Non-ribosomal peptide synthetase n=1 Tax=Podospora australis TaxID=1536484 RepID=A0AAN6WN77_9PEZI|nr:non-ribosomal peptide synthetase [Podospora australis]
MNGNTTTTTTTTTRNTSFDWAVYLKDMAPCRFPRFIGGSGSRSSSTSSSASACSSSSDTGSTAQREQQAIIQSVTVPEHHQPEDPVTVIGEAAGHDARDREHDRSAVIRTAWAVLLWCYTGQENVAFGFSDNRNPLYTTAKIARFILSDSESLASVVARAKADVSADSLVSPIPAGLVPTGQIDTAVVLLGLHAIAPVLESDVHVRLLVHESNLTLESRTLPKEQLVLVTGTFAKILSGILREPDVPLAQLDCLSPENLQQFHAWNEVDAFLKTRPVERCIHDIIADRAAIKPEDTEAVCSWDGSFTYRELDAISTRLAQRLVSLGVGIETVVPLCFDKSKWTVVSMVAVMKAGGAFVPLDPSHPVERIRSLCESVGARLLLCSPRHQSMLAEVLPTVLPIDDQTLSLSDNKAHNVDLPKVSPSNTAYIIFTSGSTGKPKGTVIEHQAFCSGARSHAPALLIEDGYRHLQFAAYTFDASLVEILTPLMVGATVCIPSEDERLNSLVEAMSRMKVNHATLTPSFINFLTPESLPHLRRLVLAGEAMAPSHVQIWSQKVQLVNGYGPAECSVAAVVNSNVTPHTEAKDIGMPCGVKVWLVDPADHDRLVPVGCVGEMLLEGPSLARGYLNDPGKTKDAFIFGPTWAGDKRRRFYKTGDLARYNSVKGSLSYVGRKDTQIKFHGQRIELGEIEHHLSVDKSVRHGLVLLPKQGPLANRLISVVSLSGLSGSSTPLKLIQDGSNTGPVLEGIQERLSHRLPAYMVPSTWVCVEDIPMLSSTKMDRKAVTTWIETSLGEEEAQKIIMGNNASSPKSAVVVSQEDLTDVESKLRDIWSLVLNLPVDQISASDRSFLSLGGDSITAMTVASQAKKLRLGLSVQDILKAKSLKQLSAAVKSLDDRPAEVHEEDDDTPFDLSPIQQYHFQVRGEAHGDEHFNQSFHLRLTHSVDDDAIRAAIETVVRRHTMLRSRFRRTSDHKVQQFVTNDIESSYRYRVHTGELDVHAAIASAQGCLDVISGPLFAAELFHMDGEQTLFMTAHHLVIDLVSWRVILDEIEEIINGDVLVPSHSLTFRRWTSLQIQDASANKLDKVLPAASTVPKSQFEFWGMQERANLYGDVATKGFALDVDTSRILLSDECHSPLRTETVDLLLASLLWSFQQTFNDRLAPAIYNEGHGREVWDESTDISRTIGWFTILFPVSANVKSFEETLVAVKDLRRRVPQNGRPYMAARFHTAEGQAQWGEWHRQMEISFNYLGRYQQLERAGSLFQPAKGSLMAGEAAVGSPSADFGAACPRFSLFEISAVIVQGQLRFGFAFNRHMLHQDRISRWVDQCQQVLHQAANVLPQIPSRLTAGDLALMQELSSSDLTAFQQSSKLSWNNIEDIYPASPIQVGLLMSRTKDGGFYAVRRTFRVKGVSAQDIVNAWSGVIQHHALLRTIFVEAISSAKAGGYDQIVLKDVDMDSLIKVQELATEEDILAKVQKMGVTQYDDNKPQHRLSVFHSTSSSDVICVLEMSHAVMDGASMDIILRDLGRSYRGSLSSLSRPLFSPFIASLQRRDSAADIDFWKQHLAGVEPCHFPVLNDGIEVPEMKKQLCSLRVTVPDLLELQTFCNDKGITLPNAFHAAWALTLACYTSSQDVCFGFLVSGRDEESSDAVGPFINMATQRVAFTAEETLLSVLESVQKDQLECMPYGQVSLAEVQHALSLPGGMSLFNTCISYRRLLPQSPGRNALALEDVGTIHDPTEYPVSVNIEVDDQGNAAIDLDYWTDAMTSSQAENVASTFLQALINISQHFDQSLAKLDFVHERQKAQIFDWNANIPPVTYDCVHAMVEKQVAVRSTAQAIRGWDGDFSYSEMNSLANRLARYLHEVLAVGPEVLVPVCFDKSAWTTIAMLAVMKAGGGVVPLDATHPAEALKGKVEDAKARVVVASEQRAGMFTGMVDHVVGLGPSFLSSLPEVDSPIDSGVRPENASFIMFTSGSTGKPKGVILCHQALVSSCLAHGAALGVGEHTRFLQFAAHTFDNSLEEMFTTLIHGGCVCVPSDADRLGDLPGAIDSLDANFMDLTPTVAALIRPEQAPKIKGMAVGGEALTKEVLDIWGGAIPVHNQYGPSECSINAAHKLHLDAHGDVASIGRSVGSVSWIVDPKDHNKLAPIGCVGELLIEGPILARGYLERPVETAKAFIEMPRWAAVDPHNAERGPRRMYKTGDLVRYDSDGSLIYLGRKDTQVKLHGQRIELGEIEHHVKTNLPDTAQSSVELVTFKDSKQALAVFVALVSSAGDETRILPMEADFRSLAQTAVSAIAAKIAGYMVPSLFFPVSKMPMTSSGKLDRRQLRTLAQALPDTAAYRLSGAMSSGGRKPETGLEIDLQQLWASVLNIPDLNSISAEDNFFGHGGDSVGAMRLAAAARQTKGIALAVAAIFQHPKLADMAKVASYRDGSGAVEKLPGPVEPFSLLQGKGDVKELQKQVATICGIDLNAIEDIYPCSPLQAGLVATSQTKPGAYVAMSAYELPNDVDISRFKQAWQDIVDSEAILRTRIVFVEDLGFLQVVVSEKIAWTIASKLDSVPESHLHLPPRDGGILARYTIVGERTFLWTAHHALYDGWSLATLLDRVEARYRQQEMGSVPHYSRFIEYLSSANSSVSDEFWKESLSGSIQTFPALPHPGYSVKATSQESHVAKFTRPARSELTTASFLRAAWAMVVSIYSSSDDVVFGEVLNGRDVSVPGIQDLVGPTLSSIPRRISFNRDLTVREALVNVQAQLNAVIPHQFSGIQRIRTLSAACAAACDFQNLLVLNTADDEPSKDSLWGKLVSGGDIKQGADFFSYPLNVTATTSSSGSIELRAFFDDGVLPHWQVSRMLAQFGAILKEFSSLAASDTTIGEMNLLGQTDKESVSHWNLNPGPLVEKRVHDLVSEVLRQEPTKTAVIGWDGTISNGDLESMSTALADKILQTGNKSKFVPFCFEKSVFAPVAMLAILKAGCAFVPLDPKHPVARLKEIVGDCEAEVILCSPKYESLCKQVVGTTIPVDSRMLKVLPTMDSIPNVTCSPGDPAYVIFTSGTTGKPKGTIISHTAFCSGAAAHGPAMLMKAPFRFLQFASYTFDASLIEIFTTLMLGGSIGVPKEEDRTNGNIAAAMEKLGITMTLLTPSFARVLKPSDAPSLKTLILGGEAMSQSHINTWADSVNLVNAYGPSECAVVATVNPRVTRSSIPGNLGRGMGRCWIVDPKNHNRLAPVGSVGELLVEGPTLSTGYLRNEAKTREVFIENPRWVADISYPDLVSGVPRRMYKTGDLVRICDDSSGDMVYMGRKDSSQAKLNGQRLELDEIVHHLSTDDSVRHALVILPKVGPCAKRLVAVLSLREAVANDSNAPDAKFTLVTSSKASSCIPKIEERLREKLPPYMVPTTWIILESIPYLPSGKLDRPGVAAFVEGMTDETLDKITSAQSQSTQVPQVTPQSMSVDATLKTIWAQVLDISPERVTSNVSFLHLGGDSITAMQVMAKCRAQGITVAVQDIIGSKSVHELALKAGVPKAQQPRQISATDEDHHEFDPSPIQQLYFQVMGDDVISTAKHMQFNQSVLLRVATNSLASHDLGRALHSIVETHSMLRARFRRNGAGSWRQKITSDVSKSYQYRTHVISNAARMDKRIEKSQRSLDIHKGPLLAADWFTVGKDEIFVFITVHHLVIDVVSWGVLLQDLEDLLRNAKPALPSLSFQTWTRQQSEEAQGEDNGLRLLPHHEMSDTDLDYWGMTGKPNLNRDVLHLDDIELDTETTTLLLGADCHKPLQSETLDVLLACLLVSYRNVTSGRQGTPTIYNEGHGREALNDSMDLSRTVGWFTTLYPVHLPDESSSDDDIISAVRWVKDYRRRLAGKGRPYFAYSLLTSQGKEQFGHRWPVEVAFNYLGQMQSLSRTDTLLQPVQDRDFSSDIGKDVPRFSLVEVSAVVSDKKMRLSFSYNKHMKHAESLKKWPSQCAELLQEVPKRLTQFSPEKTLTDFSLLPLSYYGLENLSHRIHEVGVDLNDVEDVYPCAPMQRGLLLSQMRDPQKYAYRAVFQISSVSGKLDIGKLCEAWQAVVRRHATLRTVFVDTVGDEGLMDQVVLRNAPGRVHVETVESGHQILPALDGLEPIDYNQKKPPHRLAICTNGEVVFCQLEISHTICDGSSIPIMLDDLADSYGENTQINKATPKYRDYMAYIQSRPGSESLNYWRSYLDGAEPCLFPNLNDGASDLEPSLGSHVISLNNVAEINAYCADLGITLSTLLQFTWALVVRSYTGSDEVLFGYLASGRDVPVPDIEQAVGAFINMLVCRLVVSPESEIGEMLETMRGNFADAMAHQSCSLAEMQHALRLTPGTALFNTAFTYQKRAGAAKNTVRKQSALEYRVVTADDPSEYTIAVNVEAADSAVEVHFSYWRNSVSDSQMRHIAHAFEQIVVDLVADKEEDRTVGEINLVGAAGLQQIDLWNGMGQSLPRVEECVHDIIARHPGSRPAVSGWDASFTYQELDTAATALARHLVTSGGIGPESFVPLCFEKSAWTVVAQLAVMKAGGAFVNLDPSHPDSRLSQLIEDVGANFVLCSSRHKEKMDRISIVKTAFVVDAGSVSQLVKSSMQAQPFVSQAKPSNPVYIIFTSGTTGKPKGTVIEHGAFSSGALAHAKAMFMHPTSRVLQFASYTFDASVMETLSCLLVGGCVCVPTDEDRMNDVAAVIRDMNITWTLLTPSVASTLKPESVPTLKTLVTGGEAMSAGHISRWHSSSQCALVNAYGPTECSVVATTSIKVDESHQVVNSNTSNIGPAIQGARIWVVDPQNSRRLVPIGAVGELVVEGRLVAREYLNNITQTAKAFLPSGFLPGSTDKMYRTGDLVRYNSDGSVSYISRKDTQVKLNGRRIELGEIEFHCRTGLSEVEAQAAVEVVSRGTAKSLAVFFSLPGPVTSFTLLPMSDSLRQLSHNLEKYLNGQLPAYMVPQLFVPVSAMPWTSAGKLDRRQLKSSIENAEKTAVASYRLSGQGSKRRPANETEKKLQGLWEAILGLAPGSVGVGDNFFRIGGDSLTAMRLVGAARAHRIVLSVLDVFERPVLSDMAKACGGQTDSATASQPDLKPFDLVQSSDLAALLHEITSETGLSEESIVDIYPCSPLQEGLVTLANKQTGAYVGVNTLKLTADINLDRFKQAWQVVLNETDILRTRIVHTTTAGFMQVVTTAKPIEWDSATSLEDAVKAGMALGSQNGGLLTQYAIVDGHFVWAIHHALYDGWSLPLVVKRAQELYNTTSVHDNHAPAPYANFIRYLQQIDTSVSEQFWRDSLASASAITHFPQLPPSLATKKPVFSTETHRVKLSRSDIHLDITMPTLIRAAWSLLLASYTGVNDVVFGETLAGRNITVAGIEDMVGPTFATIPTRVTMSSDGLVSGFLRTLHGYASKVVPHQHLGLQHIKKLGSDCAGACDFQNLLVIQSSSAAADQTTWELESGLSSESFFTNPLVLECTVTASSIETLFHFDERVLSAWHTKRLAYQFDAVLKRLAEATKQKTATLRDVQTFSPEDQTLVTRWNRPSTDKFGLVDSTVHEMFMEQAVKEPERVGIAAWDAQLTYSEVLDYSSRLAATLQSRGVRDGTLVPVCLDRSAWSIVTLIAVLMAGGAFVPIDPAHPSSRQQVILDSISAQLVVCSLEFSSRYANAIPVDGNIIRGLPVSSPLRVTSKGQDTAYILFTSGSTGIPKGVVVAHRDFLSSSASYAHSTRILPDSRVFHFASLTFDVALMEVLTPLMMGATVCVPTAHDRLHNLGKAISSLGATWAFLTPSVANLLSPSEVPCLKTLVCGGEAMQTETVTRWAEMVELINGYGPTEACVLCIVNPDVSTQKNAAIIGRATPAGKAWILETREGYENRLVPVGAVGELCISGPILARGYLNDEANTKKVFVDNPGWKGGPERIYRTGDLVRYTKDGQLEFFGRKDGQVKVNGQRIELGEIESRLLSVGDNQIKMVVVVQPKSGGWKKQLVGVLTFNGEQGDPVPACTKEAREGVQEVQEKLGDVLPLYMVPTAWVVLEKMPVAVSGKLDRQKVGKWVESLDEVTCEAIARDLGLLGEEQEGEEVEATGVAKILRGIWAKELHVPVERIRMNQAFLGLGGDSITAMGVVSRARNAGVTVSIQDVLKSKSVAQLAQIAKVSSSSSAATAQNEVETDEPFALSPIQSMYINMSTQHTGEARFNQSFAVSVARQVGIDAVQRAIELIVQRHAMLRSRFHKRKDGTWEQRIAKMDTSAYRAVAHHGITEQEMTPLMAASENALSIEQGPVFSVDLFQTNSSKDIVVFMVAHHLCIDMVSWRIIVQDLTQFLETGALPLELPLSFRLWCSVQSANDKLVDTGSLLPFKETPADLAYWGTTETGTYGKTQIESFTLDEATTKLALTDSHAAFRSEPMDLFLSAIAVAFARTFQDREVPTIHTENHGREAPEGSDIDLSQTVGWFTAVCPLVIPICPTDIIDTVRRTKDMRRTIPGNGRPYFAHKHLNGGSSTASSSMEIIFNYLGAGVQSQDNDAASVARPVHLEDHPTTADVGSETKRLALVEISAIVIEKQLQFTFTYDGGINRASSIKKWINDCKDSLRWFAMNLAQCPVTPTLTDYPLLSAITHERLDNLAKSVLPGVGIHDISNVEDIYPCTPVQEGMLIGQLRDSKAYVFHAIYHVSSHDKGRVDAYQLSRAWKQVVDRHQALRTVFVESVRRGAVFDQVVLRKVDDNIVLLRSRNDKQAHELLSQISIHDQRQPHLPHQLSLCTVADSGKVLMKLEVNHAAVDGGSLAIALGELAAAYASSLDNTPGPLYSHYIRFIQTQPAGADTKYWMRHLAGLRPCYFPKLGSSTRVRTLRSTALPFDRFPDLRRLSERTHVTLANIMHVAWGFVLRKYTGSNDVAFGFLTADRDAPVDGIQMTVGTLINMLCFRIQISSTHSTIEDILKSAQNQHLESMEFQRCSLAKVQHDLGLAGKPLYNTSISTQNHTASGDLAKDGLSFDMEEAHDPSEYAITVNIDTSRSGEGVVFRYWSDHITDEQAQEMAHFMTRVLNAFIDSTTQTIMAFDFDVVRKPSAISSRPRDLMLATAPSNGSSATLRSRDSSPGVWSPLELAHTWSPLGMSAPDTPVTQFSPTQATHQTDHTTDKILFALWSATLNLPEDSFGEEDNFFDLGGDSITAMKLAGDARDLGLSLTVADVFRNPTFSDMSAKMRAASAQVAKQTPSKRNSYERFSLLAASNVEAFLQTNIVPHVGVFRGGISDVLPATDFQSLAVAGALLKSRWMLNYFYLDGTGALNLVQFKRACLKFVQSLDILRTAFIPSGGRFLQVVLRTVRPVFNVIEVDSGSLEDSTTKLLAEEKDKTPKLDEPMIEFTVLRHTQSSCHRILLRISHAQYDGVCFPKILEALQLAYLNQPIPPPPTFANYLRASAGSLTSEHYQHWKTLLSGSSMTEIVPRTKPTFYLSSSAPTCTLKKTVQLPTVAEFTVATIIKAAWSYVLSQLASTGDVVFGHTISGRNAAVEGIRNMLGPCVNLLPVRVTLSSSGAPTARDLLEQIQSQQVANMPHEVLGFREIVKHCTDWPAWTYFSSTVQHQNVDAANSIDIGGTKYSVGCATGGQMDFADLNVYSQPLVGGKDNEYEMLFSFAEGGGVTTEYAQRALELLCEAAEKIALNPDTTLSRSSLNEVKKPDTAAKASPEEKTLDFLTESQEERFSAAVTSIWREVLSLQPDHHIRYSDSFFDLGGDIVGLAQVSWLLGQQGFPVSKFEDLVEHCTLRGQIGIIAASSASLPPSPPPETHEPVQDTKAEKKKITRVLTVPSLVKAVQKFRFGKKKNTRESRAVGERGSMDESRASIQVRATA